jgi:crossover junction endodeoxyribonuclease RuvC
MFDSRGQGVPLIVLGIDPGLKNTGWGVIERRGSQLRCLAYGCVTTESDRPTAERLATIHAELVRVIERYTPVECSVENVYFSTNAKTAFATGQARGAALLAAATLRVGEYGPNEIKQAVVGTGDADKRQVQYMVKAILGLPHEPQPDHAADALAAAICHANLRGTHATAGSPR